MSYINPIHKMAINITADVLASAGPKLAQVEPVRRAVVGKVENWLLSELEKTRADPHWLPGIADDRTAMGLAILGTVSRNGLTARRHGSPNRGELFLAAWRDASLEG